MLRLETGRGAVLRMGETNSMNMKRLSVLSIVLVVLSFTACSELLSELSSSDPSSVSVESEQESTVIEPSSSGSQKEPEESSEKPEEEAPKMVRIDADGGLRMREGPSTDDEIIRVIPQNELVALAETEESPPDWIYVTYEGDQGWISAEFVSYDLEGGSASEWAKAYYDYISTLEAVTYTSTVYDSRHIIAGHMVDGEMIGCSQIEFWNVAGYDYPVLLSYELLLDADGNTDAFMFDPTIYVIEGDKVVAASNQSDFFQESSDGPGLEVKGTQVHQFVFKPENGGDPDNVQDALSWLKTQ